MVEDTRPFKLKIETHRHLLALFPLSHPTRTHTSHEAPGHNLRYGIHGCRGSSTLQQQHRHCAQYVEYILSHSPRAVRFLRTLARPTAQGKLLQTLQLSPAYVSAGRFTAYGVIEDALRHRRVSPRCHSGFLRQSHALTSPETSFRSTVASTISYGAQAQDEQTQGARLDTPITAAAIDILMQACCVWCR